MMLTRMSREWPVEDEAQRDIGQDERAEDGEDGVDDLFAASHHLHTDRRRRATDEPEEQGIGSAEDALPAHEHGENHRRNEADTRVEENSQHHSRERDGHELGPRRAQMAKDGGRHQHDRE
jgi:hypothetical protein